MDSKWNIKNAIFQASFSIAYSNLYTMANYKQKNLQNSLSVTHRNKKDK